jgi:C1A family cysteine protease
MTFVQIIRYILVGLIVTIVSGASSDHEFTKCSKVDHLGVSKLEFSSSVASPGSNLDIYIHGTPDQLITDSAKAVIEVRVMGIKMYSETVDLCNSDQIQDKCPLASGKNFVATISYLIPVETPSMTIEMTVKVFTKDDDLACFKTNIKVGKVDYKFLFQKFVSEYKLNVDHFEKRLAIFTQNLISIIEHNSDSEKTYTKRINKFGLVSSEEFKDMLGYRRPTKILSTTILTISRKLENLENSIDWVKKGAVTPVKNQGKCGSCWSFSTTGAIEGAYFIKTGKLVSFSEQQLVDCDTGSMGCKGGIMDQAFEWVGKNRGLCSENDYPYVSIDGQKNKCTKCNIVSGSKVKKFVDVPIDSETELMNAVSKGPVSVAIQADQTAFQFYHTGVLTGKCGSRLDHGVLVVGYGTDDKTNTDFWKVKNSWGANWGEDGYIRIQRGKIKRFDKTGECGILSSASYPILV